MGTSDLCWGGTAPAWIAGSTGFKGKEASLSRGVHRHEHTFVELVSRSRMTARTDREGESVDYRRQPTTSNSLS